MSRQPPPHETIAKMPAPRAEGVGQRNATIAEEPMTMTEGQATATRTEIPIDRISIRRAAATLHSDQIARRIPPETAIMIVQRRRADLVVIQTVQIPMIQRAIRPGIARPTKIQEEA